MESKGYLLIPEFLALTVNSLSGVLVFASIQQTSNRLNQLGSNFVAIYSCMPQCKGKNFELSKFKNLGEEKCCMHKCWLYNYANSLCSLVTYLYKNLCGKTLNKGLLYIKPLTDPFRTCKIKLFKNIQKKNMTNYENLI